MRSKKALTAILSTAIAVSVIPAAAVPVQAATSARAAAPVKITKISKTTKTNPSVTVGKTTKVKAKVTFAKKTAKKYVLKNLKVTSSKVRYASVVKKSVAGSGRHYTVTLSVKGKKAGRSTIKVAAKKGGKTVSWAVSARAAAPVKITKISKTTKTNPSVTVGKTTKVKAKVTFAKKTAKKYVLKNLKVTSSKVRYASVVKKSVAGSGRHYTVTLSVKGKKAGRSTIKVAAKKGGKTVSWAVKVRKASKPAKSTTKDIQILSTSDIHGMYLPYDYTLDAPHQGSLVQIATAFKEKTAENPNTVKIDVGDDIQDNMSDIFAKKESHPYAMASNYIGYDYFIPGNHEFNFGVPALQSLISQMSAQTLLGNVKDAKTGAALGSPYAIKEIDGVKVGIIGDVSSNITRWDPANLKDYTVTNTLEATKEAVKALKAKKVDIIIAAVHVMENNEYDVAGTGFADIAKECPDIDVILAAHGHTRVNKEINGVLITENVNKGETFSDVDITVKKQSDGSYDVVSKKADIVSTKDYAADQTLADKLKDADAACKAEGAKQIGTLDGEQMTPDAEISGIPSAYIQETPLIDFVNEVQNYYAGTKISATALSQATSQMMPGKISNKDIALVYKFDNNTLCKVRMNKAQLLKWLEWTASFYNQYKDGDLTYSFNKNMPGYNYDMFSGIKYDVNISKPVGQRIENLTYADGTPIPDDAKLEIACNNYRANTALTTYGSIFKQGEELPTLVESDIKLNEIGGLRNMIKDYIQNVKGGTIQTPKLQGNWKITGADWNQADHDKIVAALRSGKLTYPEGTEGTDKSLPTYSFTKADLAKIQ